MREGTVFVKGLEMEIFFFEYARDLGDTFLRVPIKQPEK